MDPMATAFVAVVGVWAINFAFMRTGWALRSRPIYVAIQTMNVVSGGYILAMGLPGFENARGYTVVMGMIFFFRAVMNHHERQSQFADIRREQQEAELERLRAQVHGEPVEEEES